MYRVIEVADLLGVSKVTIYKKIEKLKPQIEEYLKDDDGIIYVDDLGVNLIRKTIKKRKSSKNRDRSLLKVVDLKCELNDTKNENKNLKEKIKKYEYDLEKIYHIKHENENNKIKIKNIEEEAKNKISELEKAIYILNQQKEEHKRNYVKIKKQISNKNNEKYEEKQNNIEKDNKKEILEEKSKELLTQKNDKIVQLTAFQFSNNELEEAIEKAETILFHLEKQCEEAKGER